MDIGLVVSGLIKPLLWSELGTAVLCGVMLGCERQIMGKPTGMRTSILICLGTYVFIKLGFIMGGDTTANARVLGQVITGIGFLGAGVIITRQGMISGITSAAVIWVLAAIGAMIGQGYCKSSIVSAILVVLFLQGINFVEKIFNLPRHNLEETRQSNINKNGIDQ